MSKGVAAAAEAVRVHDDDLTAVGGGAGVVETGATAGDDDEVEIEATADAAARAEIDIEVVHQIERQRMYMSTLTPYLASAHLWLVVCGNSEDGRKKDELNELEELTKDQRTVFVSQLVMKTTDQNLREYFGQLGQVKSIVMIRDKNTGRHKGAGYVEMGELEAIPMVLQLNGTYPPWQPRFPILVKASEAEKNFIARKEASAVAQQAAEDKSA